MGLRFRQRIKVFPGVHLNVSLGGLSVSMGGPGATVNIGKGMRVRGTVGLPGTGLSYQGTFRPGTGSSAHSNHPAALHDAAFEPLGMTQQQLETLRPIEQEPQALTGATWTPPELMQVQNLIIEAHQERQALDAELRQLQQSIASAQAHLAQVDTWWRRWFFKLSIQNARSAVEEAQTAYAHVQDLERQQGIPIRWSVDEGLQRHFARFTDDIRSMLRRAQGWHLLGVSNPVGDNRAWHSSPMMNRTHCTVGFGRPAFFSATDDPMYQNTPCITGEDGLALYFYPTFILVQRKDSFGLLPPKNLNISVDDLRVAEHDVAYASMPTEEYTWHYVNKNGTPDQRYTYNPQVPLLDYHRLTLSASQGLHETFLFDNAYAFASWMGVRDWYEALDKHSALQTLAITPVQWSVRPESDATYFVAQHEGKEVLGFGFTRRADQFWVCLNTEPLGVGVSSDCTFHFWIDAQHLELGNLQDITKRIGTDDAAFRICPHQEGHDWEYIQQCLGNANAVFILVERNEVPIVRLRLALADPSPFWEAIQRPATVE